jgi:hypothetical protein
MSNTLFKLKRSAVKGKSPTTGNLELGELAINTNDGRLFFKTTDSASSSAIQTLRQITASTGITVSQGAVSITNTGVTADTVGSSTRIPILTVNAQGQITALDSAAVAGVSTFTFDSASATLNISTADGGSFNARIGLSSFSTSDLSEGTNLYYTTVRGDSDTTALVTSSYIESRRPAEAIFSVVNNGFSAYSFTGDGFISSTDNPVLYLQKGLTYKFNVNAAGHPFEIRSSNGGSAYNDGVTNNGAQIGAVLFTVPMNAPNTLYYQCQYHSVMGATIYVTEAASVTTDIITEGSTNLYYTSNRADSDAKNAISGGTGVTYNNSTGSIAIGQSVGTTDDVTFAVTTMDSAVANNLATNYVTFTTGLGEANVSQVAGRVYYNDEYKALSVYNDISSSSLQLGHEEWTRVYNNSGSTITSGTPVYITGATGETFTVAPADATTETKAQVLGIVNHDILNTSPGVVTTRGLMSGLNTSNITAGSRIHLSVSGGFTDTSPTYPYYPTDLGTCIVQDSANGYIYVSLKEHHAESYRITGNAHIDGNLNIDGNLSITGTQSVVTQANLAVDNSFVYLNSGNTIGAANTISDSANTGLDDLVLTGHYDGTTTKVFYVEIDSAGTTDSFKWWTGTDSAAPSATGVVINVAGNLLSNNISATFNANTGHTVGDRWYGTASPTNVDTGWFSNRNTGTSGVGYTHLGIYFDVSDDKFKVVDEYYPEPSGLINNLDSSYSLGVFVANTFEGNLTGNVTGNVTGNATTANRLDSASAIFVTGDVVGSTTFDGSSNSTITTSIASGVIVNDDINASAGIVDTKLATISTAGKVSNSATTATSSNTSDAIVARDPSGNFSAGTITANLTGTASNADTLDGENGTYYRINVYNSSGSLLN